MIAVLSAIAVFAAACGGGSGETTTTTQATTTTTAAMTTTTEAPAEATIADIVVDAAGGDEPQFTVLLAALQAAGLVDAVADPTAQLTVFAPTDDAFAALLDELGVTAEELLADEGLADILLYHVVPGVFSAEDVVAAAPLQAPTLLEGQSLAIAVSDGSVVIDESATVVQPDISAGNGIVHVIDAVLVPPGS